MDMQMDDRLLAEVIPCDDYEWQGELKPLVRALAEVQWALRVHLDGEVSAGNRGYRYATLPGMWQVLRPLLQEHRLLVQQLNITADTSAQAVRLLTQVTHVDSLASVKMRTYTLKHAAKIMNSTQAEGSALTYAKKRALMGLCGIAPEDLDANDQQPLSAHYVVDPWTEFTWVMTGAEMNADIFRSFVMHKYQQNAVTWDRERLIRTFQRLLHGGWTTVINHEERPVLEGEE